MVASLNSMSCLFAIYRLQWNNRRIFAIGAIGFAALALVALYPLLSWENLQFRAQTEAVTSVLSDLRSGDPPGTRLIDIPINFLVRATICVVVVKVTDITKMPPDAELSRYGDLVVLPEGGYYSLNWLLIIALSTAISLFYTIYATVSGTSSVKFDSTKRSRSSNRNPKEFSADEYLTIYVDRALERSEELFLRSTLLLVGGVVMAFVGVAIFFVVLSSALRGLGTPEVDSSRIFGLSESQIFLAFKSTAMLVFIEAIAWFLLRQYRALIEDYKSFYRYYMRRSNYLVTLKLLSEWKEPGLRISLANTILTEDLSGKLSPGESTELIEGQKLIDANFVELIVTKGTEIVEKVASKTSPSA